jgi:hypothetical protein
MIIRKKIFLGLISFSSIVITLAFFELLLRVFNFPRNNFFPFVRDQVTGFKFAPNLNQRLVTTEFDILFTTNSKGFRDDEILQKKKYRILFLGDSFTCGYGVNRKAQFADLLEKKLNVDIINAGIAGYETVHQLMFFNKESSTLNPDLVVYFMFLGNDISGNSEWSLKTDVLVPKNRYWAPYPDDWRLISLVKLFVYAIKLERRFIKEWRPIPSYLEICKKPLSPEALQMYSLSEKILKMLQDSVTASGNKLLVILIPISFQVENNLLDIYRKRNGNIDVDYDFSIPELKMVEFLVAQKIPFKSLTLDLRLASKLSNQPIYYAYDGHFTAAGHLAVSDILYPILKKQISEAMQSKYQ